MSLTTEHTATEHTSTEHTTDPEPRLAAFEARGTWEGNLSTAVAARHFDFTVAEPTSFGGTDEAANPIEYLLGALSGCVTVVVETVAAELGVAVRGIDSHATGTLDLRGFLGTAAVSPHFQHLTLTVSLTSPAATAVLDELRREVGRRCPILNLVKDAGVDVREVWEFRAP